jgi:hypothetical protein
MRKSILLIIGIILSSIVFSQKLQETRSFDTPKEVVADGKMMVFFHKSDKVDVVIDAEKVKLEDIYTKYENNKLLIRVEPLDIEGGKVTINVYTPAFEKLALHRGAIAKITQEMFVNDAHLTSTSGADIRAKLNNNQTTIKATSGAFIQLEGKVNKLKALVHSGANVRTDSLELKYAEIKCRTGGFIATNPTMEAKVNASLGGEVKLLKKVRVISKSSLFGDIFYEEE